MSEALAYLDDARRAGTRSRRRSVATTLYALALTAAVWVPGLMALARTLRTDDGVRLPVLRDTLSVTVPALLATALLAVVRSARWRGPVLLDEPAVQWVLPRPLARRRVLLPRFATAAGTAAAVGAAAGAALGLVTHALTARPWPALTAAGAWAGAATALTATACGALVERHGEAPAAGRTAARLSGAATAAVLAGTALAATAVARGRPLPGSAGALLWSGPWGWAAQPFVRAAGGPAPAWPVAAALTAAAAAAATTAAWRATPGIPTAALRRRATTAARMTASLFSLDLRRARAATRTTARRPLTTLRLPMPRSRHLVVPWRDATALLRSPGRPAMAAGWLAAAVALTATSPAGRTGPAVLAAVLALAAAYLAAAQLAEPARLDSDDPRRGRHLPYSGAALALWHAAVPAALLTAGLAAGAALCGTAAAWTLVGCVPGLVGAALVSAHRGALPPRAAIGTDTPFGNTASFQLVGWYLRGPLGVLATTAPALALVLLGRSPGPAVLAGWLAAAGAAQLAWARRAARRLHRGG
ncbi:DUF6297 family protein [Streptomyces caatingaensis]|uniref:DUF6297 family protein n=1 Tax=Streptomyces caatingaensis TaxID=1678637 RepID=UPI0006728569|nr:DUF6297 family protein [Streptomyces caatingaensis]